MYTKDTYSLTAFKSPIIKIYWNTYAVHDHATQSNNLESLVLEKNIIVTTSLINSLVSNTLNYLLFLRILKNKDSENYSELIQSQSQYFELSQLYGAWN